MKKLILLLATGVISVGAFAQSHQYRQPTADQGNFVRTTQGAVNKTTGNSGPRWYDNAELNSLLNPSLSGFLCSIWFDSTVRQNFTTGYGTINFSSVSHVTDPTSDKTFNDPQAFAGLLKIPTGTAYNVDSVSVEAAYARMPAYSTVVDTLIISMAVNNITYYFRTATSPWAAAYLPVGKDTVWGVAPTKVDSLTRSAYSDGSPTRLMWKVPLTAAMGDAFSGTYTTKSFNFATPSTFTIPAGSRVAVTYTFKTGLSTWAKNVDSINKFNRFMPVFVGSTSQMAYHWYDLNDRNGSSLLFSTDTSQYEPSVEIEGNNSPDFRYEILSAAVKLSCANCLNVSVGTIDNKLAKVGDAVPNPATSSFQIPVTMIQSGSVVVNLMNTVGQIVKTQDLGNVAKGNTATATFSTSDLANGVYIYTVKVNGQSVNGRVLIAH